MSKGEDGEVVDAELLPVCNQAGCVVVARTGQALCDEHAVPVMLASAHRKLVASLPAVTDVLIDLSLNGSNEAIRCKASTEIMDRAGLRGGVEVDVVVGQAQVSPADLLRERLTLLRRRTLEGAAADAEVVDETVCDE